MRRNGTAGSSRFIRLTSPTRINVAVMARSSWRDSTCDGRLGLDILGFGAGGDLGFDIGQRCLAAGRLGYRLVELFERAKLEPDRMPRLEVRAVPMAAVAHRVDRRFGRADQLADLRVRELGMIA